MRTWLSSCDRAIHTYIHTYIHTLSQRLGKAVGGLHEAGHDLAGTLADELLHPLYGRLVALAQPQLLLHECTFVICVSLPL